MLIPCDIIFQCLYSIFFVCSISYFLFKTIHPEKNLSSGAHIQNLWSEMIFLISSDMTGESPTYGRWREYMEQHSGFAVRKKWTGNTKDSLYPVGQENPLLERERMYPCNMERKKMWFLVHPIKKNNKKSIKALIYTGFASNIRPYYRSNALSRRSLPRIRHIRYHNSGIEIPFVPRSARDSIFRISAM